MAATDTQTSQSTGTGRGTRRKATIVAVLLLFLVTYWPGGPILEANMSPTLFLIWVVLIVPALVVLLFLYNAYQNIEIDKRREGAV